MVEPINNSIVQACKDDLNNHGLLDISLTRKQLKSIILTKTYNVTTFGVIEQLKSVLDKVEIKTKRGNK